MIAIRNFFLLSLTIITSGLAAANYPPQPPVMSADYVPQENPCGQYMKTSESCCFCILCYASLFFVNICIKKTAQTADTVAETHASKL
jgi:hypothetical protein